MHHLWAQSQKTAQYHWPRSFLHLVCPFGPQSSRGLTHVTLIAACVTRVVQPRNSKGQPLLYLLRPAQNTVSSCEQQGTWKIWRMARNIMSVSKRHCWTINSTRERKQYMTMKQVILTRHNGVKELCPLLSTHRTTKGEQLVTCRVVGRTRRTGGKKFKTKTTELRNRLGTPLEEAFFQLIHTVVENLLQKNSNKIATQNVYWGWCTSR